METFGDREVWPREEGGHDPGLGGEQGRETEDERRNLAEAA